MIRSAAVLMKLRMQLPLEGGWLTEGARAATAREADLCPAGRGVVTGAAGAREDLAGAEARAGAQRRVGVADVDVLAGVRPAREVHDRAVGPEPGRVRGNAEYSTGARRHDRRSRRHAYVAPLVVARVLRELLTRREEASASSLRGTRRRALRARRRGRGWRRWV